MERAEELKIAGEVLDPTRFLNHRRRKGCTKVIERKLNPLTPMEFICDGVSNESAAAVLRSIADHLAQNPFLIVENIKLTETEGAMVGVLYAVGVPPASCATH